jgi:beta-alanine degradation protein BauB
MRACASPNGGFRLAGDRLHRHEHDYCVVPMTTGKLRAEDRDGAREAELIAGQPYFREAGVEHDVININPFEFVFIEIELKG